MTRSAGASNPRVKGRIRTSTHAVKSALGHSHDGDIRVQEPFEEATADPRLQEDLLAPVAAVGVALLQRPPPTLR